MSTAAPDTAFSEKAFYLDEFRGRTIAFALPSAEPAHAGPLGAVLAELSANGSRSLVLSSDAPGLEKLTGRAPPISEQGLGRIAYSSSTAQRSQRPVDVWRGPQCMNPPPLMRRS